MLDSDDDDINKKIVTIVLTHFERNKLHSKHLQCYRTLNTLGFSF